MESFDQSLKYLLHEEPEDFLRFGFADPTLTIVGPCETGLPSRGRDVDGSYFVMRNGVKTVAHIEFHRRHQSANVSRRFPTETSWLHGMTKRST